MILTYFFGIDSSNACLTYGAPFSSGSYYSHNDIDL